MIFLDFKNIRYIPLLHIYHLLLLLFLIYLLDLVLDKCEILSNVIFISEGLFLDVIVDVNYIIFIIFFYQNISFL